MTVKLRTVIFSRHLEISNVPVYTCRSCRKSIVCPACKPELKSMLQQYRSSEDKKRYIDYAELNEYARLLVSCDGQPYEQASLQDRMEERINELLDMLLIAGSIQDQEWIDELERKLKQLTLHRSGIDAVP